MKLFKSTTFNALNTYELCSCSIIIFPRGYRKMYMHGLFGLDWLVISLSKSKFYSGLCFLAQTHPTYLKNKKKFAQVQVNCGLDSVGFSSKISILN